MKQPKSGRVVIPRNNLVALAMVRSGAGVHDKTRKAKRRTEKVALMKKLAEVYPSPGCSEIPAGFGHEMRGGAEKARQGHDLEVAG